jgi:hypothetical protein
MELKDIITLTEVATLYTISRQTLRGRLKYLVEGVDYRKLGERQPILLTPKGAEKILNVKEVEL